MGGRNESVSVRAWMSVSVAAGGRSAGVKRTTLQMENAAPTVNGRPPPAPSRDASMDEARADRKHEWIRLNVGGNIFMTTKTTLSREPQSFFFRLCQEDPELPSEKVRLLLFVVSHVFFDSLLDGYCKVVPIRA